MLDATTVELLKWEPALQVAVMGFPLNAWTSRTHRVVKGLVTERLRHLNRTRESTLTKGLTSRLTRKW